MKQNVCVGVREENRFRGDDFSNAPCLFFPSRFYSNRFPGASLFLLAGNRDLLNVAPEKSEVAFVGCVFCNAPVCVCVSLVVIVSSVSRLFVSVEWPLRLLFRSCLRQLRGYCVFCAVSACVSCVS